MKIVKIAASASAFVVSLSAIGVAAPSNAAVILCTGANCVNTDSNVLVNAATAPVITGTTNNGEIDVRFTSTTDATLVGGANGQASVGAIDNLLNQLTFTLENGFGFRSALFNLEPVPGNAANEATSVFVNYTLANGSTGTITQAVNTNGQNFIGITGTNGEIFTSGGFTANPTSTGISELRQLRLGGLTAIGAVPEPTTWALFLLGFFGIGGALRHSRKARIGSVQYS